MKKYTLFYLVFILFIFLFSFNVNSANADNCAYGELFNNMTGKACGTTAPIDCKLGDLFSSITGKSCSVTQPILYCSHSDFRIGYKGDDVKMLQIQLNAQGENLKIDGSYGKLTQVARMRHCHSSPTPTPTTPSISTTSLPSGTIGVSYSAFIAGLGGENWSATGLPVGLNISTVSSNTTCSGSTATSVSAPCQTSTYIVGTPTTDGIYTVVVTLTSATQKTSKQFSLVISAAGTPTITNTSLPDGIVGTPYNAPLSGLVGSDWSASGLPDGLNLRISTPTIYCFTTPCPQPTIATISGIPTTAGIYPVMITLTSGTQKTSKQFNVVISAAGTPTITTISLPSGVVGSTYSASIEGSGGNNSYQWFVAGLPEGLQTIQADITCHTDTDLPCLNKTPIIISGTPTTAGTYIVIVTLSSGTRTVSKQFSLVVATVDPIENLLSITTTSLSNGVIGSTYSANVAGSGGSSTDSYNWSITGLPDGLQTISATITCFRAPCVNQLPITIVGTPTTAGTYTVNVKLTSGTQTVSKQFSLVVASFIYALPFCGQPPMPTCQDGFYCAQIMPAQKTYTSYDTFNSDKATYSYAGSCKE